MTTSNRKPYVDPNPTIVMQETPTDSPSYPWEMENAHFYGLRNADPYRQHERVLFIVHGTVYGTERKHIDDAVSIWKVNHHDGDTYYNTLYGVANPDEARAMWDEVVKKGWVRDDSIPPRMREGIKAMKMDLKTTSTNYALEA